VVYVVAGSSGSQDVRRAMSPFFHFSIFCFTFLMILYGHVLKKEDNDWVKKCMEHEVVCVCVCTRARLVAFRQVFIKQR